MMTDMARPRQQPLPPIFLPAPPPPPLLHSQIYRHCCAVFNKQAKMISPSRLKEEEELSGEYQSRYDDGVTMEHTNVRLEGKKKVEEQTLPRFPRLISSYHRLSFSFFNWVSSRGSGRGGGACAPRDRRLRSLIGPTAGPTTIEAAAAASHHKQCLPLAPLHCDARTHLRKSRGRRWAELPAGVTRRDPGRVRQKKKKRGKYLRSCQVYLLSALIVVSCDCWW